MTLVEIAELVGEKVNKTDVDSIALIKRFVRRRYQLTYDSYLWKDSLDLATVSNNVHAGVYGPTNSPIMPRWMERVVAVREGGDTNLTVEEQALFFKRDPALYGRVGSCSGFHQVRPYWWVEYDPSTDLYCYSVQGNDGGKKVYVRDNDSGARGEMTLTSTLIQSKATEDYTDPYITKDATNGPVILYRENGGTEITMAGFETSLRYERIRLLDDPGEEVELLVLGKRRIVNLEFDSDAPIIQNIDDALIAHAQADMLERARQYAKAESKRKEASAQVQKAIDLENNQSAKISLLTPASYHNINNGDDI